jgi:hypothetical protein
MGYINSFGIEVYFTVLDHFGLRGSATTLISTSTSATMATMIASTTSLAGRRSGCRGVIWAMGYNEGENLIPEIDKS